MEAFSVGFTRAAQEQLPNCHLGLVVASGINLDTLAAAVASARREVQRGLASPSAAVLDNLEALEAYFATSGYPFPLAMQRARMLKGGIPNAIPLVQLLLCAELRHGMLIGIQDSRAIDPPLNVDVATRHESFRGMRGVVQCKSGEIVIRDARGIIASFFQGPDSRTQLHADSRDIVGFVFSAPGMPVVATRDAVEYICSVMARCAVKLDKAVCLAVPSG